MAKVISRPMVLGQISPMWRECVLEIARLAALHLRNIAVAQYLKTTRF